MKTYKIMTILILILLMISTISQPIQDQKCTSITTIIPTNNQILFLNTTLNKEYQPIKHELNNYPLIGSVKCNG